MGVVMTRDNLIRDNLVRDNLVRDNLEIVFEGIGGACKRVGRVESEVTLIAVSKTQPVAMIEEAYRAGIRDFGENWVQELDEKVKLLPGDIRWHMIGHLQRNKVKHIIGKVYLVHGVDSLRLASEISKEALKKDTEVNILIEVNVAEEESKFGVRKEDVLELVRCIAVLPGICIKGLMTIPPYVDNQEKNRQIFSMLHQLAVDIGKENIDNVTMNVLSMGMTGDYQIAIEEGATYIRVGTGIFGDRVYSSE